MEDKKDDNISLRGDKKLWVLFVNKIREQKILDKKINVWKVLEGWIKKYIDEN